MPQTSIHVAGRRWDSGRVHHGLAQHGQSIEAILTDAVAALRREGADRSYARRMLRYCRCRVNGLEIPRKDWPTARPQAGARLEFLLAPKGGGGGGGGGKSPLATVLTFAVVAAAIAVPWLAPEALGLATGSLFAGGSLTALGGMVSTGILLLGGLAVNMLFPTAKPSLGSYGGANELEKESQVYSINGSRNAANPYGFVPLVLGRHKHTPPLASKSWTVWEGEKQFFNMLVVWGHAGIEVTDFKIGDTPLADFKLVSHQFHAASTGSDLTYFAKSYNENSVSALIKQAEGWTTRTVGEAEDLSIDIAFQAGLCTINQKNGATQGRTIQLEIEYCTEGTDDWQPLLDTLTEDGSPTSAVDISGSQTRSLVRNFRREGLPRAVYQVRVRRITADTSSQYIRDEATWQTMRAILNQPAFSSPVPLCVSELRIQASEQLSGYVDDFNGICQAIMPDYDAASGQWVERATSNPASCLRYMLTSPHSLSTPFSPAKLDDASLVDWHMFCAAEGFHFDFVCDTEETLWNRLTQIAAAGRAGVTMDNDGLYGVAIDRKGLAPVQVFTPRNSWGLTISREYARLPHALRVKFVNAANDWQQDEGFVYADGYSASNATDIVEWDFPGKTNWQEVWRHGRYYLARTKLRPISISLSTDWEWRLCRRGDLVGVASDVLMNVFGTARVQRLGYLQDGQTVWLGREADLPTDGSLPVGVELDDSIDFSEPFPARYGISVRNSAGRPVVYEIQPQYGEVSNRLIFANAITAAQVPPLQGLATVSILGDEYAEYLVAGISPAENASAELTLIPYAPEIMDADSGEIPDWQPPIHLDVTRGRQLPSPLIINIKSDESVLTRSSSGAVLPRIAVWWSMGSSTLDTNNLNFQISAQHVELGSTVYGTGSSIEEFIAVQGVEEGAIYDVRLRAVSTAGQTSPWSAAVRHVVVGRTTPPPPPSAIWLDGNTIRIDQADRPLDVVGHVITMVYDADDTIDMGKVITSPYVTNGSLDLTPWAGRARRVFVQTIDSLGLLSEAVSVAVQLGDVLPENVLFTVSELARHWTGEKSECFVNASQQLQAQENEYLWTQDAAAPFWPQEGTAPLWPSGSGLQMTYIWQVPLPGEYAGARVLVEFEAQAGKLLRLEYRQFIDPALWAQDSAAEFWPQSADAPLWATPTPTEWAAAPDDYVSSGYETLEFRVTWAAGVPAVLDDIKTILDVPDREWAVENMTVLADGSSHVPVPALFFRAITNVQTSLQYRTGDTAVTVTRVQGTEVRESDGFLSLGPVLLALDASRNPTAASVDVRLKGY